MKTGKSIAKHYKVAGGHGEVITRYHAPYEDDYPWWIVPAVVCGTQKPTGSVKLSVHSDGTIGDAFSGDTYPEIARDNNGITYRSVGAAWSFSLSLAVCRALDKHAGSQLSRAKSNIE